MRYNEQINLKLYKYTNGTFQAQAIIDDYQEISFEHNLYEAGTFTITINYNIPNALKFERGMFIQFGNDPYMFGEILTISDAIGEDGKGSQTRTITGKDARYIFKRRVIRNLNNEENWVMTDKGEICLRSLIGSQCGTGAESKRQLPVANTIPLSQDALGKEYSVAEAYSNLYDTLVTIATQSEIGWRIRFDGTLTLEVYQGADLSEQVQFSTTFDSLSNGEFTDSSESYANTVYVAGKGTGSDRDIYEGEQEIEGASPSGLDRFEAYDNQSQMTSESEYEAEALSMLTQYGQTINVSGQGLAKCPYIFKEQYDIGDTITLAFSGKSAKAQILSVTEHWTWGVYNIQFSFGKPQNDLSRQLQLILKQIQKASNKTTTTSSLKYYTIPTDTAMPKADVIYDTIGFTGACASGGSTFTLYFDSEKTGAKTYHVYFKQLGGGKLTLTTGVSGKANLVLNSGTYVAIIYVDQEGNVTSQGATATSTIEAGNTQPATSDGVASAISSAESYDFSYYVNGEATIFKIEVPYVNNGHGTTGGRILINARYGCTYVLDYYNFINESNVGASNNIAILRVFDGNGASYLENVLKWDIDTTNRKVKFYLKKSTLNTRFSFKVLQSYNSISDVKFSTTTDSTVWTNAQFSNNFEYLSPTGTIESGNLNPITSNALAQQTFYYTKNITLPSAQWVKVCEFGRRNYGGIIELDIVTAYQNTVSSAHSIKVVYSWQQVTLEEVTYDSSGVFDKIRVCWNSDNNTPLALFIHYNKAVTNPVYCKLKGMSTHPMTQTYTLNADPTTYANSKEYNLGTSGVYVNGVAVG